MLPPMRSLADVPVGALPMHDRLVFLRGLAGQKAMIEWGICAAAASVAVSDAAEATVRPCPGRSPQTLLPGRPRLRGYGGDGTPECSELVTAELAVALGCTERQAGDCLAVGLDLLHRLPRTSAAFAAGTIGYPHARIIATATRRLSAAAAAVLDARLAEVAATRNPTRLRVIARRAVDRTDPAGGRARHAAAHQDRSASLFPIGDGMAAFSLNHDLAVLAAVTDQVEAWGRRRHTLHPAAGRAAHTADAAALLLQGRHPVTGQHLLHPPPPAHDATLPQLPPAPATPATPDTAPPGQADRPDQQDGPDAPDGPVADPRSGLAVRTVLRLHLHADTLLGLDQRPADLQGHGPITADQARRLILTSLGDTTLHRVFTDPADDSVLFLDPGRYPFTHRQKEHLPARWRISAFPTASQPATGCDIDHRTPYRHAPPGTPDPPGQTVVTNAHPLGRRHHRTRTHGRWQVQATGPTPCAGPAPTA
jgi:hypothetical protein